MASSTERGRARRARLIAEGKTQRGTVPKRCTEGGVAHVAQSDRCTDNPPKNQRKNVQRQNKAAPYIDSLSKRGIVEASTKLSRKESGIRARARQFEMWEAEVGPPIPHTTSLPADFILPTQWVEFARQASPWKLDRIHHEGRKFLAWHRKGGRQSVDWDAAWQHWVLKGIEYDAERQAKLEKPAVYGSIESRIQNNGTRFDRMREKLAREGKL